MFKLGIMASGPVGKRAVEHVAKNYPGDLVALVGETGRDVDELIAIPGVAGNCAAFSWENDIKGSPDALAAVGLDVLLLAWWPAILKPLHLALAPTILNFHPSLLPFCRGKDPNFWALKDGEPFGVTIHHVEEGIDSGPIAFQRSIDYGWLDNAKSLYELALSGIVDLFADSYPQIRSGSIPRIPQPAGGSFHYRKDMLKAVELDLDATMSVRECLNLLRAKTFPPHAGCTFEEDGRRYSVTLSISPVT